jgi:predicted PolB exonuclease-like 3'-5' exonuclease
MIINESKIDDFKKNNPLFKESLFFDIETTGLNPKNSKIVMIGVMYLENNSFNLKQLFSEENSENQVIYEFLALLKKKKYIITYNGNSFDLKFIKYRSKYHNLQLSLENKCLIDLYSIFRKHSNRFKTKNLKLKTMEEFLGINRKDNISGKDFIRLYNSYLLKPKIEYLELMWLHNYEDVVNLPELFSNYDYLDNINVSYKQYMIDIFFNDNSIRLNKNRLFIDASTYNINKYDSLVNDFNYKLNWSKKNGEMVFEILTKAGKLSDGRIINYINLSDVFDNQLYFNNIYNIPQNLLPLSVDKEPLKKEILKFISLLFEYKKIP